MTTQREDESALVAQAQMGDEEAFAKLYQQCSRQVYRRALKLTGDHQEAEDVLQDAFLKAFVHLGEFRQGSRFSTWLISIAGNEAMGRLRRPAARKQISLDAGIEFEGERLMPREIQDPRDDAEEAYGRLELRAILSKVIGKLSSTSQMLLALRYEQNESTEATARMLGLSIPAVKTRLLRARLAARKGLGEYSGIGPR